MRQWIVDNWEHVLCGLLIVSRVGDVGTTLLMSPKLELEANPIARRWPRVLAVSSLLTALLPYYHAGYAFAVLVAFLLVSAHNAGGIWLARGLGEGEYARIVRRGARAASTSWIFVSLALRVLFFLLLAILFVFLGPGVEGWDWIAYGGFGILVFALATTLHSLLWLRRVRRLPAEDGSLPP